MDESWRVPIGSVVPRRRTAAQTRRAGGSLGADDFRDVFGGAPRSVLLRQFSGGDPTSPCSLIPCLLNAHLHADRMNWFRPNSELDGENGGWTLPEFPLPAATECGRGGRWVVRTEERFYNDVLESGGGISPRRTRSWQPKSKSNTSLVLSSDDGTDWVGRPRASLVDDAVVCSVASNRSSAPESRAAAGGPPPLPSRSSGSSLIFQGILTPPTVRADAYNGPFRSHFSPPVLGDGLQLEKPVARDDDSSCGSPLPAVSSIYDDIPMATIRPVRAQERLALQELEKEVMLVVEDERAESYGAIEIAPRGGKVVDAEGAAAVGEAIAWAKEKFRASSSSAEETRNLGDDEHRQGSKMEEEQEHVKAMQGIAAGKKR